MTDGQGWPPPAPPPTGPPRRFATKWIWIGAVVGMFTTAIATMFALWANTYTLARTVAMIALFAASFAPIVLGIVLAAIEGPPARRGLGLGLIIGWALSPIVFAGICILVLVGVYTFPGGLA